MMKGSSGMEDREILFALHQIEGIGWKSIEKLMDYLPSLQRLTEISSAELERCLQDVNKVELIQRNLSASYQASKLEKYQQAGIRYLTILDEAYPDLLRQTFGPPWVLYYLGDPGLFKKHAVAMVGTRTPTTYGKRVADSLSQALSEHDICVVSGLARGIDSASHIGALRGSGSTIAVLGTPMNVIYPPENTGLFQEITQRGLIVSEFPLGMKSHPGLFPLRNRVIAGLSLGTLVVEAAEKSGSLITADMAMNEGRDIFAVPGPITSPKSQGALTLMKQGAKVVTTVKDILEEYIHILDEGMMKQLSSQSGDAKLSRNELKILDIITIEPMKIDEIIQLSKFDFGHLHSVLLSLLLKNKIAQLSGSTYVKL
jgi:DNA processing protein